MGGMAKVVKSIPLTIAKVIPGKASSSVAAEPAKPAAPTPTPTAPAAQAAASTAAQAAGLGAVGEMFGRGGRRRGRAANILMGEAAGGGNVGQKRLLGE
jgi:hypothetical protein